MIPSARSTERIDIHFEPRDSLLFDGKQIRDQTLVVARGLAALLADCLWLSGKDPKV